MKTYVAEIFGSSWSKGPQSPFKTITEARKWAESFGTGADICYIKSNSGNLVAVHRRDQSGEGTRWFKACA